MFGWGVGGKIEGEGGVCGCGGGSGAGKGAHAGVLAWVYLLSSVKRTRLKAQGSRLKSGGGQAHAEAKVVETVPRPPGVAARGPAPPGVVPGEAAAHHAPATGEALGVLLGGGDVGARAVQTPLPDVAVQVVQAERVRGEASDRLDPGLPVRKVPGHLSPSDHHGPPYRAPLPASDQCRNGATRSAPTPPVATARCPRQTPDTASPSSTPTHPTDCPYTITSPATHTRSKMPYFRAPVPERGG